MSGYSETRICPRCDSDSFEGSIDFEEVDGMCNECGYEYHTVTSLMTLEEVNVDRAECELEPLTELKPPKEGWEDPGTEVKPSTDGGYFEVVWVGFSGNEPERHIFHTREDLVENLHGDWSGGVIAAIFDPEGNSLLEELDDLINDEGH